MLGRFEVKSNIALKKTRPVKTAVNASKKKSTGFDPQTPALLVQALAHYPTWVLLEKWQH